MGPLRITHLDPNAWDPYTWDREVSLPFPHVICTKRPTRTLTDFSLLSDPSLPLVCWIRNSTATKHEHHRDMRFYSLQDTVRFLDTTKALLSHPNIIVDLRIHNGKTYK